MLTFPEDVLVFLTVFFQCFEYKFIPIFAFVLILVTYLFVESQDKDVLQAFVNTFTYCSI